MKRVCLVGVDSSGMLGATKNDMPVGGEAVQKYLLARAFKSLGYDVSLVVMAVNEDVDETIEGIRVISAFKYGTGIPVLRFFYPRATGLFRALGKVNADIYYESPASILTGLISVFCRWKRKKFIFRIASDVDCIPGQQLIESWRDRKLFEYGLRRADLIAVQSRYQQQMLKRNYGLESAVVNMALEVPEEENLDGERDIDVLWISNLKYVKRPDRLLSLAGRLSKIQFTMIGGPTSEKNYYAEIEREATNLPNVRFLGHVPYQEVNEYVARSKILVNTSDVEGFPNTFLQAWVRKVPVVSFFDPDQIITREGLGRRPSTDDEMCSAICELLENWQAREKIGEIARDFAIENYSSTVAARRYIALCAK